MKKIHYTDRYLLNPYHPVTVFVIGAGGTGSQVATGLARMSVALQALGHPGLHVTVFDPDTVTEANIGRQLFSGSELGLNKAAALATRINRFFRLLVGGKGAALSAESLRRPGRTRPGEHHRHLYRQHPLQDEPLAVPEETQGTHFQQRAVAHILDGLRQRPDHRTGPDREHPWQDSPARLQRVPAHSPHERHYRRGTLLHHQGKGFGTELLAGGSFAEAGPFHQFHTGTNRLRHPVAYAQGRKDILPGCLSQSRYATD
ncbi:PRTRC_ThiF: PRTRC system ThiF family protein [Bacteroides fragilis]